MTELVTDIHNRYTKALDNLTREQFQQALEQALTCGDFIRLVCPARNSQGVIYLPYAKYEELSREIAELKKQIEVLQTHIKELESSKPDPTAPPFTGPTVYSATITQDDLTRAFQDGRNSHFRGMP